MSSGRLGPLTLKGCLAGLECSGNTDEGKSEDLQMSAEELRRHKRRKINRESARRMRLKPRLEVQEQKTMISSSTSLYPMLVVEKQIPYALIISASYTAHTD